MRRYHPDLRQGDAAVGLLEVLWSPRPPRRARLDLAPDLAVIGHVALGQAHLLVGAQDIQVHLDRALGDALGGLRHAAFGGPALGLGGKLAAGRAEAVEHELANRQRVVVAEQVAPGIVVRFLLAAAATGRDRWCIRSRRRNRDRPWAGSRGYTSSTRLSAARSSAQSRRTSGLALIVSATTSDGQHAPTQGRPSPTPSPPLLQALWRGCRRHGRPDCHVAPPDPRAAP